MTGIERFHMEGRGVIDVEVELAIQLPLVFFLDEVVEADILELAEAARLRTGDDVTGRIGDRAGVGHAAIGAGQEQAGIAEGRPAALRVFGVGADGEVALGGRERRTVAIAGGQQHARAVAGVAIGDAGVVLAVRTVDRRIASLDFQAVEVLAGDEVDHAADGVGAVGGGRAVLQHFDPADGGAGDQVGVHIDGAGRGGHAAAVEQHQGAFGAEAPEVGAAGARRLTGAELVGFTDDALHGGDRLHQVDGRGGALLLKFVIADDVDGQGGVFRRARDERAGDDDLFNHGGRVSARGLSRGLTSRKGRGDGEDRSGHQIMRASHAFPRIA